MTKYSLSLLMIALLMVLAASSPVSAQLYDNGAAALGMPDGIGDFADVGNLNYTMAGDVFVAPTTGNAYTINFAGIYYGGTAPGTTPTVSDTFTISLYTTNLSGAPDTTAPVVTSTMSDVGRYVLGLGNSRTIYQFTGLLDVPLMLTAGTSYYLGISDKTNSYNDFAVAHTTAPGASYNGYSLASDGFVSSGHALSFELVAPEPSEWALMAVSLAGLAIAAMRKQIKSDK